MKKNILLLLSLCLVVFSCSKDDEDSLPLFNLEQTEASFSSETGTLTIPFESNTNWTAEWSESWLNVYPSKGDASTKTITFTLDKNETYDVRRSVITITSGGLTKEFAIDQRAMSGLLLTEDDEMHKLSNDASTIEVEVKTNVELDITISDKWITQVATRGLPSTMLKFDIAANESYDSREGTITIKQKNGTGTLESVITVFQSQEDAIILSDKTLDLSGDKQTIELDLQTNVDFEIIIPQNATWVTYTPTRALRDEVLVLDIAANETGKARTADIYVKNKENNYQEILTINQSEEFNFNISPKEFDLTSDATTIELNVKTEFNYDVIISGSWINNVTEIGSTPNILTFDIEENEDVYLDREGSITIQQKGGTFTTIIPVFQSKKSTIVLSSDAVTLWDNKQTLEVDLETNVDFEVIIPEDATWITYTPTRSYRTETLSLNIAINESSEPRTAKILIKDKDSSLQETLTITQLRKDFAVYHVDQMGSLGTMLSQAQKDTITTMIVKGEINQADFSVLKKQIPYLTYLDLKDVNVQDNIIPGYALGGWAGNSNEKIKTLILPVSATEIGNIAFGYMLGLETLIFPEGMALTKMVNYAFHNCPNVTSTINIPLGLTDIEKHGFWGMAKASFRFPHTTPIPFSTNMITPGVTVEVPSAAVDSYKAATGWKGLKIVGY